MEEDIKIVKELLNNSIGKCTLPEKYYQAIENVIDRLSPIETASAEKEELQHNEELMKVCIELARQGIDIEKVCKSLEPIFDVCKEIIELAAKNYKYMLRGNE